MRDIQDLLVNPKRYFVVTGICRSGTSLLSVLLNKLKNCVCLNEIMYDVMGLPASFAEVRRRVMINEPLPNKYDKEGNLTTDTMRFGRDVRNDLDTTFLSDDARIGSKVNDPYLLSSQILLNYGYHMFIMIRNPVYTIASWNVENSKDSLPDSSLEANKVMPNNFSPRWKWVPFITDDKISRQAELWNWLAMIVWCLGNKATVIKYEDLVSNPNKEMQKICDILELENTIDDEFENKNIDSRFEESNLNLIKEKVKKLCPAREYFGYK